MSAPRRGPRWYLWQDKMRESMQSGGGLKEALDWRDGRYGDYRTKA